MAFFTLQQLASELKQLFSIVEESDGELTDELAEALKINRNDMAYQLDKYYSIIQHVEAEEETLDFQIKRLEKAKKTGKSLVERIKKEIIEATILYGEKEIVKKSGNIVYKFKGESVKSNLSNRPKVIINNIDEVPEVFKTNTYLIPELSEEELKIVTDEVEAIIEKLTITRAENFATIDLDKKIKVNTKELMEHLKSLKDNQTEFEQTDLQGDYKQIGDLRARLEEDAEENIPYAELQDSWSVRFT